MHGLFDFKTSYFVAPRPLIFKLQQDVLKLNDICMSRSSSITDLVTNFLNPENRSFENLAIVTFNPLMPGGNKKVTHT